MLALKTVFAGKDELYSFVFDEIDTGISGQTAWKVSGKMGRLARDTRSSVSPLQNRCHAGQPFPDEKGGGGQHCDAYPQTFA